MKYRSGRPDICLWAATPLSSRAEAPNQPINRPRLYEGESSYEMCMD